MTIRQAIAAMVGAVLTAGIAVAGTPTHVSDLSVTISDAAITYVPGRTVTYTIVVSNAGPDPVAGATVTDPVTSLAAVASAAWTCEGAGGATCTAGPKTGNLDDSVSLPVGGTATYTLVVVTRAGATADLVNTVTVAPPVGNSDPGPRPNTAADTNPAATLFYVATTGTDSATCGPTATPCKTIQTAIDNAEAGDAVIVRAGTYNECIELPPGGGAGGIYVESDEFFTSGTFLDTEIDGAEQCDGAKKSTPGPVVRMSDGSTLRGFTIQNGGDSGVEAFGSVTIQSNLIQNNHTSSVGGGIYLEPDTNLGVPSVKAIIEANTIAHNTSARDGAGIYVSAAGTGISSAVEITDNQILTNTAGDGLTEGAGGGIAAFTGTGSVTERLEVTVSDNVLDGNVSRGTGGSAGGGIFVSTGGFSGLGTETVTVEGNAVRNNVAGGIGGGIYIHIRPGPGAKHSGVVASNTVSANSGKLGGGGLALLLDAFNQPSAASPTTIVHATSNSIVGNHVQGDPMSSAPVGGGGIFAQLDSARTPASAIRFEIDGNTIQGNDAMTHGGGAWLSASANDDPLSDGATMPTDATVSFHNNLVAQNAARDESAGGSSGGGVHAFVQARGGSATAAISFDFNSIVENQTEVGTGGIQLQELLTANSLGSLGSGSFTLANSIVSDNEGYGVGFTSLPDPKTAITTTYTDAFGNVSGNYQAPLLDPTGTTGNISVDPALDVLFLPRICGPMVDAGDPAIDPGLEPLPNGGRVNMGHLGNTAGATRTMPDVNGDGTVDGLDVMGVAVSFGSDLGEPRFIPAADRDLNDTIDGDDLAFVTAFYAQTCP